MDPLDPLVKTSTMTVYTYICIGVIKIDVQLKCHLVMHYIKSQHTIIVCIPQISMSVMLKTLLVKTLVIAPILRAHSLVTVVEQDILETHVKQVCKTHVKYDLNDIIIP